MNRVRSIDMEWTIPDTFYSEYFHTLHGQLEYWLLLALKGQLRIRDLGLPPFWYGALNEMCLYLEHPAYSPFLYNPRHGNPKRSLSWDMRNVPEGQGDLVDENFIPLVLQKKFK